MTHKQSSAASDRTQKVQGDHGAPMAEAEIGRRCAAWSLPGAAKGRSLRRAREMVTRVVSKIATPNIKIGASHAERCEAFFHAQFQSQRSY